MSKLKVMAIKYKDVQVFGNVTSANPTSPFKSTDQSPSTYRQSCRIDPCVAKSPRSFPKAHSWYSSIALYAKIPTFPNILPRTLKTAQHVRSRGISLHLRPQHLQAEVLLPLCPQRPQPPMLRRQAAQRQLATRLRVRDV